MDCCKGVVCREQVLAGVRILFSRVIPLEQPPASHALWRLAEAFGAACTTAADPGVTHVVASTRGTEKVFWALQTGKQVVLPAWYAPFHSMHILSAQDMVSRAAEVRQASGAARMVCPTDPNGRNCQRRVLGAAVLQAGDCRPGAPWECMEGL